MRAQRAASSNPVSSTLAEEGIHRPLITAPQRNLVPDNPEWNAAWTAARAELAALEARDRTRIPSQGGLVDLLAEAVAEALDHPKDVDCINSAIHKLRVQAGRLAVEYLRQILTGVPSSASDELGKPPTSLPQISD